MVSFIQDVRFALRGFCRNPGFTAMAVIVLGVGIGANVAIFSVADALVLRPLPFPAPHELVAVPDGIMYPDFVDMRAQARSLQGMALYRTRRLLLTAPGEPEAVNAVDSSAELFSVLGIEPALGRSFAPNQDQPGRPRVAVVSHSLWARRLGADPRVLGRSVTLDGQPVTVIGVAPPSFRFPLDDEPVDLWLSLAGVDAQARQWRGYRAFRAIGRLAPGVGLSQARVEVGGIAAKLAQLYPKDNAGRTISFAAYDDTVKTSRPGFLVLLTAVAVVLLIACANVAGLQLVRAASRLREMAVRAALGAGRGRIIRQSLTESLVLTLAAAALGLMASIWGVDLLMALLPDDVPRVHSVVFDGRVLLYALVTVFAATLVVGVVPALQLQHGNLLQRLRRRKLTTPG